MKWVSVIDLHAWKQGGMDQLVFAQLDPGVPSGPRKPAPYIWMGPPNPDDNWWQNNRNTKPRWLDWFLSLRDYKPVPRTCLACGATAMRLCPPSQRPSFEQPDSCQADED